MQRGQPAARPAGAALPCWDCPKRSPREAHQYELSAKNNRTLALWYEEHGVGWACLTDAMKEDRIFRRNMALITQVMDAHREAEQVASSAVRGLGG